jgi:PAS domain S-box-containing protein
MQSFFNSSNSKTVFLFLSICAVGLFETQISNQYPDISYLVSIAGSLFYFMIVLLFVKAAKKYVLGAYEKEILWKALTESAPVGIYRTDKNGKCVFVNDKWQEITGLSAEAAYSDGWSNAIHPDDRESVFEKWNECVAQKKTFEMEFRFQRADESIRWVRVVSKKLDEKNPDSGYFRMDIDITREMEIKRKKEFEKAYTDHSDKMATLGEMAAGIAHEINNPLAIIQSRSYQIFKMTERNEPKEKIMELADSIEQTVGRIAKIIRGLKSFSRDTANDEMDVQNVKQILDETLELCRERVLHNNIKLIIEGDFEVMINCKPTQISQVLINLINNSFDAILLQENPWIKIKCLSNKGFVDLSVTDSGNGIPKEIAGKIMNPFFTTKEIGKGTGLGLSIASTIVANHKGKLWLDRNHTNTRFVMTLPIAQEQLRSDERAAG